MPPTIRQLAEREIGSVNAYQVLQDEDRVDEVLSPGETPVGRYCPANGKSDKTFLITSTGVHMTLRPKLSLRKQRKFVPFDQIYGVGAAADKPTMGRYPERRQLVLTLASGESLLIPVTGETGTCFDIYNVWRFMSKVAFWNKKRAAS